MKEKKRYVILCDSQGDGLETFATLGLEIHDEGKELEVGIYYALKDYFEGDDLDAYTQEELNDALENVVLLEVTDIVPKVRQSREVVERVNLDIWID